MAEPAVAASAAASSAGVVWADHLDDLKRALGLVEDEAQRKGAVDRLFGVFDETATAKIEKAGRAFESLAAKIGRRFLPAIGAAADATSRYFDKVGRNLDADERATTIQHKRDRGEALSPDEQRDVDRNPDVRGALGLDPDPAATSAAQERKSKVALKTIQDLDARAKETGDPQMRVMVQDAVRDFRSDFPGVPIPGFADGGRIPSALAHRGRVSGPGGPREDKVPALLSAGEFVVKASEAAKHHGLLTTINDGRVPRFADGGPVRLAAGADASAPVRALQRGVERGADAEGMARLLAKLGPEAHGKPLTVDQIKTAMVEGTKAGVVAGMREAMDTTGGRAAAGAIVQAAAGGDGEGGGGEGGGSGRPLEHPSLRYGGGYGPGGRRDPDGSVHHRSVRFGGGYGPRPGQGRDAAPSDRPHPHDRPLDPDRLRDQARRHGRVRSREDGMPADDGHPRPPMPGGGEGRADPSSLKGVLFKGESGGDPGIYNHRVGRRYRTGHLDPNNTTVAELQRRQAAGEVFAAGKYQIIPKTMRGAVKALGLKGDERFDSALQDWIYTDYLAGSKRPQISAYVTGKSDNLRGANIATAEEWASVGDPSRGGRGHYDGDGANHASISVDRAQSALKKARDDYQHLVQKGVDPETARRSALLGIRDPQVSTQPAVAERRPAPAPGAPPAPVAENPAPARRHRAAAAAPAGPVPVRMAAGGRVVGPGGPREDLVPAMLSHGEFVVHAAAAAKHTGLLADLNSDRLPGGSSGFASARFSDPSARPAPPRAADAGPAGGSATGGEGSAGGPAPVQNFYGMHDPAVTARRAQQERNREVRRSQARALHSVGRIS